MRAGPVSAAALRVSVPVDQHSFAHAHCGEAEYAAFIETLSICPAFRRQRRNHQRRFIRLWPDLAEWFSIPLVERVARHDCKGPPTARRRVSYESRSYLYYLALTDRVRLDYEWLLAIGDLRLTGVAGPLGIDLGIDALAEEESAVGLSPRLGQARDTMDVGTHRTAHRYPRPGSTANRARRGVAGGRAPLWRARRRRRVLRVGRALSRFAEQSLDHPPPSAWPRALPSWPKSPASS